MTSLTDDRWSELIAERADHPERALTALAGRARRRLLTDGRLFIVAADHTARGMLGVPGEPFAMADRRRTLDAWRVCRDHPGVGGVRGSPDVLEELALLGALDGKLAFGTMNRGGVMGASWELHDRMPAHDAQAMAEGGRAGAEGLVP